MADIAASNVTYSIQRRRRTNGVTHNLVSITFGDGVLTYPTGGVPLTKGKMGMPTDLQSLVLADPGNANGFVYKWDQANNKLRIYQGDNNNAADAPLIELIGGAATPASAVIVAEAVGY